MNTRKSQGARSSPQHARTPTARALHNTLANILLRDQPLAALEASDLSSHLAKAPSANWIRGVQEGVAPAVLQPFRRYCCGCCFRCAACYRCTPFGESMSPCICYFSTWCGCALGFCTVVPLMCIRCRIAAFHVVRGAMSLSLICLCSRPSGPRGAHDHTQLKHIKTEHVMTCTMQLHTT